MAWYDEAVFYHIYPLGLTGAPEHNPYAQPVPRLREIFPWIAHVKEIGCNAIYIGPLFESEGHGYETTDYKKLDGRLGTNEDLKEFVKLSHEQGIRVIFDGVFNHTGRNFFAMRDLREKREQSPYRDWYQNVNFWGNNEFNDGFSYDNWGGYNIMAKLNQKNPAVRDYVCDVIRFWVKEFDVDGIRLDAADVLDFEFMKALRRTANEVKPEFWLMGEVIHGDYTRWVNEGTLHSVTNYHLHKALYSGHNEHNYFEIAHTVKRLYAMGGNHPDGLKLYNFVDNHDVERIHTKLWNKAHFLPVHVLLYALPGIPSVYYGSEFGIEGKKIYGTDAPLRPKLNLADFGDCVAENPCTKLIAALGRIHKEHPALSYGDYQELVLTNRQYAFARSGCGECVYVAVNNDDNEATIRIPVREGGTYLGLLTGKRMDAADGWIEVRLPGCGGDVITLEGACVNHAEPVDFAAVNETPCEKEFLEPVKETACETTSEVACGGEVIPLQERKTGFVDKAASEGKAYECMTIEELQEAILSKMEKNGPVTEQMLRSVWENNHQGSLLNWVRSFR